MHKLITYMMLLCFLFVFTPSASFAADCPSGSVVNMNGEWVNNDGTIITDASTLDSCEKASKPLEGKILRFVKILSTLVIVFALAMIVHGGFKYIASIGDPRKAEEAKTQILYAGVGLFIVLAAFTILQLFIQASGG